MLVQANRKVQKSLEKRTDFVNQFCNLQSPQQNQLNSFGLLLALASTGPTLHGWEREEWARSFGWQMRLFLGRDESLRAGAVHVRRSVWGAPASLRSKAGSPRADVRLAAVHCERQAAEVSKSWGLTMADHPEQCWGVLHRRLRFAMQRAAAAHTTCAHEKEKD